MSEVLSFNEYIKPRIKTIRIATGFSCVDENLSKIDEVLIDYYLPLQKKEAIIEKEFIIAILPTMFKLCNNNSEIIQNNLMDYCKLLLNEIEIYKGNRC